MLDYVLSNVIGFLSILPLLIVGSSYALFVVSFASIAVHSVGNKRKKADENRHDQSQQSVTSSAGSKKVKDLYIYKIANGSVSGKNLHPDLFSKIGVIQDDTILHICSYLTPKSITNLAGVNKATSRLVEDSKLGHAIWQSFWFRDYGNVLLGWETSRDAIQKSLRACDDLRHTATTQKSEPPRNLANKVVNALKNKNTKEFYFRFQLAFVDYVLAGHNAETKCLMGIHGHIFDFTEFAPNHPGLSGPILLECGKDVTYFFEDIRHSKGARRIAQRLCLIVDQSRLVKDFSNCKDIPCGLYCPPRKENNLAKFLRETNTRPPTADENHPPVLRIGNLLPMIRPTLGSQGRIRTLKHYQEIHQKERSQLPVAEPVLDKATIRIFYDPFLGQWKGWHTDSQSRAVFSNFELES